MDVITPEMTFPLGSGEVKDRYGSDEDRERNTPEREREREAK